MKKFTCKEIMNSEGGCDMEFAGDDMMEVAGKCGQHIASSTDQEHKINRDMMAASHSEEEKKKWFEWFKGEWDKKDDE